MSNKFYVTVQLITLCIVCITLGLLIYNGKSITSISLFQKVKWWWLAIAEDLYNERKRELDKIEKSIEEHRKLDDPLYSYEDDPWWTDKGISISNHYEKDKYGCMYTSNEHKRIIAVYSGKILNRYVSTFSSILGFGGILGIISFVRSCH